MNFKLIGTGIAAMSLLATSFSAEAADMPVKGVRSVVAYYNWTGFYAGVNVGYAFGTSNWDFPAVNTSPKGPMYGFTFGYNYQAGSIVWGIEADYDWATINGTNACAVGIECVTRSTYLATVRGRLGYAFDRFLPYFTGGVAFGNINATVNPIGLTATKAQTGWTAGVGLEYAFLGNWTTKIEYLYVDLGKFDTGFLAPLAADNVSLKEHVIRVGVNYKFSGPVFARW